MGYFHRKPRRQSERALKESLRLGHAPGTTVLTRAKTFREWRYVRLWVPAWHLPMEDGQGVFRAAGWLLDTRVMAPEAERKLRRVLHWFNRNLTYPDLRVPEALFWFKLSAAQCHRRVVALAKTLGDVGVVVESRETNAPGRIVYQDRWQIAAVPPPADG